MKKIPENVIVVAKAVAPLLAIIILFIILAQVGFGKISEIRSQIATARKDQAVLTEKLDLLRTVAATGVEDSNIAVNSLPEGSPSLAAMAQIKTLAANSNLILRSMKSTGVVELATTDLNNVQISFNVLGSKSDMEIFLKSIKSFAPISTIDSIKIAQSGEGFLANVTVKSFWAPLPTKLPSSIEQFTDLTPEEKQILADLSNLTQPTFVALPPPGNEFKSDPFIN
jgi:Tfp pilus assembly protein PilO